jgi:DNA-binding beta-propeller fold protein YncE
MKTKRSALACAFIFSLVFLAGCNDRLFDNPLDPDAETRAYEIVATLQAANIVPLDLTFSGDVLWVVDAQSRILALNYNSGALIRELDFPLPVSGIAYDGKELWLAVKNSNQVVQVNIVNGAQIKALNLLRGDVGCLAYAAERLYVADKLSNTILVVNTDSGTIEKTINQPGFTINGIVLDDRNLWTIDASQNKIFRLDGNGAAVNVYQPPSRSAAGLAFSQGFIWCGDQTGKIYKLKFQ